MNGVPDGKHTPSFKFFRQKHIWQRYTCICWNSRLLREHRHNNIAVVPIFYANGQLVIPLTVMANHLVFNHTYSIQINSILNMFSVTYNATRVMSDMSSANKRRHFKVTLSLIGWAQTYNLITGHGRALVVCIYCNMTCLTSLLCRKLNSAIGAKGPGNRVQTIFAYIFTSHQFIFSWRKENTSTLCDYFRETYMQCAISWKACYQ